MEFYVIDIRKLLATREITEKKNKGCRGTKLLSQDPRSGGSNRLTYIVGEGVIVLNRSLSRNAGQFKFKYSVRYPVCSPIVETTCTLVRSILRNGTE